MSLVKICGIRVPGHAIAAAESGADYLGFMFAPSRRQVTAIQASELLRSVREAGHATLGVGVFVDPSREELDRAIEVSGVDMVQLSGDESPELVEGLSVPVVKVFAAGIDDTEDSLLERIGDWSVAKHIMLDANDPSGRGGTGKRANWELAASISRHIPVTLAGGLDPDNVAEAIAKVRPVGVDVSSGVETDGIKDPEKIRHFVKRARAAFADQVGVL